MWNFKGTLWNSTHNILPMHWKIWFLYYVEILRALRFKSSYAFLKRPSGIPVGNQSTINSISWYSITRTTGLTMHVSHWGSCSCLLHYGSWALCGDAGQSAHWPAVVKHAANDLLSCTRYNMASGTEKSTCIAMVPCDFIGGRMPCLRKLVPRSYSWKYPTQTRNCRRLSQQLLI